MSISATQFENIDKAQKDIINTVVAYVKCAQGIDLEKEGDFRDLEHEILSHLLEIF